LPQELIVLPDEPELRQFILHGVVSIFCVPIIVSFPNFTLLGLIYHRSNKSGVV